MVDPFSGLVEALHRAQVRYGVIGVAGASLFLATHADALEHLCPKDE